MAFLNSPRKKNKNAVGNALSKSSSTNALIREIVSSRSPPYINSKNRITELSIEDEIHKTMKLKQYPCLAYINYRTWLTRNEEKDKESYLDGMYMKGITQLYRTSHLTALQSKLKLKFLTNSMQKLIKSEENCEKLPIRIKRNTLRKSLIADKFAITPKISKQKFSKELFQMSQQVVSDFSEKLDSLRSKKGINFDKSNF